MKLLTRLARTRIAPWHLLGLAAAIALVLACDDGPLVPTPVDPLDPPAAEPPGPVTVTPTLPPLQVVGTTWRAGGAPWTWIGVSAFDAAVRVAEGDTRYLDWAAEQGFTIVRVVVASVYRTPRTIEQGLAQLEPLLDAAAARGLYVEVVIGTDTAVYGLSRDGYLDVVARVSWLINRRTNAVVELANEIGHQTQAWYLADLDTQRAALAMFDAPVSAGSSHGGQIPRWDAGGYLTHHGDRWLTPEQHGEIIAAAQRRYRKPVVDDEWIGFAAVAQPGRRSADPALAYRQGRAARHYGYGATLHLEAGLEARVEQLDDIQREAARRFVAAWETP